MATAHRSPGTASTATYQTESPAEALARIRSGASRNDLAAVFAFADCGIDPFDVRPRQNVLTFRAWQALGRRVAKGATSVRVEVWIPTRGKSTDDDSSRGSDASIGGAAARDGLRLKTAFLFHESQTVPADAPAGARPSAWNNPRLVKPGTHDAA
ncbi:ArdC-like ssDNA-binding domain-containing protein [Botrimarina mediterranea]|uniref:N-terminal domain-containing protein n=1 Tax=Botrimarina mediterranea TaxID=2528022 RepID=A0A518KC75_9BACT|nr:ArdC-like ssDNA-binding domain-containing protein [Botrimarina mediterranea]QDV75402.1 hypothetical protein Spa11_36190 [Botrimarina mediterranea]